MLWDNAMAEDKLMTSRLNKDNSIPVCPCVTPSHIAGTPPATCATALYLFAYPRIAFG